MDGSEPGRLRVGAHWFDAVTQLFVALDFESTAEAMDVARLLAPHVDGFKVGLELLLGCGPQAVTEVRQFGLPVFADAKLADIPNTVERAARQLGRVGARYITVHAGGGEEMIAAACRGLGEAANGGLAGILAVTVLTSLDDIALATVGVSGRAAQQVALLAKLAAAAGAEGVVCAVNELSVVREAAPDLLRVTPGIRVESSLQDDQRRTATPAEAVAEGADILVVGRPITRAQNPVETARAIADAIRP